MSMPGFDTVTKGLWKDMERGAALFIMQGNMAGTEQVTAQSAWRLAEYLAESASCAGSS